MPTAHRLPSGSWRCQVRVAGSRRSVTAPTRKEAELAAADLLRSAVPYSSRSALTFGEAAEHFLADKSAVFSPATLRAYRNSLSALSDISRIRLASITNLDVQRQINAMAAVRSPKTVRCRYEFISAVIHYYRPDLHLHVNLPPLVRQSIAIPSRQDLAQLLRACSDNPDLLTGVILASGLGLRASEVCALTWDDIDLDAGTVTISHAMVRGSDGHHLKAPKSLAGYRTLTIPPSVRDHLLTLPRSDGFLVSCTPHALGSAFSYRCSALGFPYCFHDLRHYYASVLLALGVPDKYAQGRMGHSSTQILRRVYQHTMADKQKEIDAQLDNYFRSLPT